MPHELARMMAEIRELDVQQAELQAAAASTLVDKMQKAGNQALHPPPPPPGRSPTHPMAPAWGPP